MSKVKFPCLFESTNECKGLVVKFYDHTCGKVVVKDSTGVYEEGDFRAIWINCNETSTWKPFLNQQDIKL